MRDDALGALAACVLALVAGAVVVGAVLLFSVLTGSNHGNHGQNAPHPAYLQGANASAVCVDGTYSYSVNDSGTCSHHGGVYNWLSP
jgi:hypothetical protein